MTKQKKELKTHNQRRLVIPLDVIDILTEMAEKEHRSVPQQISYIVNEYYKIK